MPALPDLVLLESRDEVYHLNPRGEELLKCSLGVTITAGVFVVLRLGLRARKKLLGWDDFWIVWAMFFSILLCAAQLQSVKYGFGKHTWNIPSQPQLHALFYFYLGENFYKSITWPTKISILLMYRRIFLPAKNDRTVRVYGMQLRYLIWGLLAVVVACYIGFEAAGIFQCRPIRASWDYTVDHGYCTQVVKRMYVYAGINCGTDIMILLLPMPLIIRMRHLPLRQRVGLMAIFGLGGFVCITTLVRVSHLDVHTDLLYQGRDGDSWTAIEANSGIICACLPLLRSVLVYLCFWRNDTSDESDSGPDEVSLGAVGGKKEVDLERMESAASREDGEVTVPERGPDCIERMPSEVSRISDLPSIAPDEVSVHRAPD